MFEDGQRGVSESTFYATEVQLEVQFLDEVNSFFEDFLMENIFVDDWVGDTLWVKEKCFEGAYSDCYAERKYTFITKKCKVATPHPNEEKAPMLIFANLRVFQENMVDYFLY